MAILAITEEPTALEQVEGALSDVPVTALSLARGLPRLGDGWQLILVDAELNVAVLPLVQRLLAEGYPVAVMSRHPTLELTMTAVSLGAADVLEFPPTAERLLQVLESCGGSEPEPAAVVPTAGGAGEAGGGGVQVIGRSTALLAAFRTAARVADSTATVLIRGESGTGKELMARVLHERSRRSGRRFVAVNCAAIPENLLESELFGHERGSFTGALARRIGRIERATQGTLFLDEVGDMSLALQARLLRVLQEREIERVGGEAPIRVDVRFIAATNRDLEADVASGRFREDLYYRLAVVPIELPPLRERDDDVRMLAEHYLGQASAEHGRKARRIDADAMGILRAYHWPGNVRQLRNVMERAALLAESTVIRPCHLPAEVRSPDTPGDGLLAFGTLAEVEERYIRRVLDRTGGHMAQAAALLGIHRNTLRRKLESYETD